MIDYKALVFPAVPPYPFAMFKDFQFSPDIRTNIKSIDGKRIAAGDYYIGVEKVQPVVDGDAGTVRTYLQRANGGASVSYGKAIAIIAIPIKYVSSYGKNTNIIMKSMVSQMEENFNSVNGKYMYLYITDDNKIATRDGVKGTPSTSSYYQPQAFYPSHSEYPAEDELILSIYGYVGENNTLYDASDFLYKLQNDINARYNYDYGIDLIEDDIIELIKQARDSDLLNGLKMGYVPVVAQPGNNDGYYTNIYITTISTSIPIFGIDNPKAIADYFKNGDKDGVLNQDWIDVSQIDLSTDWTVYVRGARYPDIWVTMKSPGLDAFLTDKTKNESGLKAEDFKVQWRYPKDGIEDLGLNDNIIGYKDTTVYGKTLASSWREIVSLDIQGSGQNIDDYIPESFYATLEFRLFYSDDIYSEWCYCEIGYIGSPSVPAFSKQRNDSGILFIDDGSTVTIIYDEYPPNRDGYEDPDIGSDVGDTSPKESGTLGLNKLTTSYKLTNDNLQALGNFLWSKTFLDTVLLVNNNPIECIVGVKTMPIALDGTITEVYIGNVDTKVGGEIIKSVPLINVGSIKYDGYYGNFLDYAPFTQVSIFLPFIGFLELDVAQITGHTLNIKYSFDVVLGQCKAMLFVDDIYFLSADGTCGIDIPLISSNRAQVEAQFAASVLSSLLTGDVMGATAGAITDYVNMQYHYTRSGQYSPTLGWGETRNCYLVIAIPVVNVPSTYAHDFGLPCNLSYGLATLSGYTVCAPDIDLSGIPCTATERDMIKEFLTSGVYL